MDNILKTYDFVPPVDFSPLPEEGRNNRLWRVHTGNGYYVWKTYTSPSYDDPAAIDWDTIHAFFCGYSQWIHLTEQEILALPRLIRLRNVMALLWWLGRQRELDRIPTLIGYLQNSARWFEQYETQFVDTVSQEVFDG
jgi:Ser/Thr protein kinase RdoA (MazF antagonist)